MRKGSIKQIERSDDHQEQRSNEAKINSEEIKRSEECGRGDRAKQILEDCGDKIERSDDRSSRVVIERQR